MRSPILWIFLLATGLYSVTIGYQFAYDDTLQILLNPQVTEHLPFLDLSRRLFAEPSPPGNLFRPFATMSYALTNIFFGLSPSIFHGSNIILYGIVCVLVFCLVNAVTKNQHLATVATLLFAVHPLHTEVVANVIGRAELGSTLFVLLACFAAARSARSSGSVSVAAFAGLTMLLLLTATLWKESSLTACILIPYFAFLTSPGEHGRIFRFTRMLPVVSAVLGAALMSLLLRRYALGDNFTLHQDGRIWPENPIFHLSFTERIIPSFKIFGDYIRLLVLPLHQSADYSSMPEYFFERLYSMDGAYSLVAAFLVPLWGFTRCESSSRFFTLWLVGSFALTINLFVPIGTLMGDRLTFLPSIGACSLVAFGLQALSKRLDCKPFLLPTLLCSAYLILSAYRIPVWQNNSILFAHTALDAPYSPKAHYNVGVQAVLRDPQSTEGEAAFRKALDIHPKYVLPTRALADIMLARKDFGRLEFWYRQLLELTPEDETVRKNLNQLEEFKRAPR